MSLFDETIITESSLRKRGFVKVVGCKFKRDDMKEIKVAYYQSHVTSNSGYDLTFFIFQSNDLYKLEAQISPKSPAMKIEEISKSFDNTLDLDVIMENIMKL